MTPELREFLSALEAAIATHYHWQHLMDDRNPYPPVALIGGDIVCR